MLHSDTTGKGKQNTQFLAPLREIKQQKQKGKQKKIENLSHWFESPSSSQELEV